MTSPRATDDTPADPFLSEQDLLEQGQFESSALRTPAAPAEDPLLAFLPETPDPPAACDARRARWPRAVVLATATCGAAAAFACWAGLAFSWRAAVDPVPAASAADPAPQSGDESRPPAPHRQPRASVAPAARSQRGEKRPAPAGDPRAAPPNRQLPVNSLVPTGLPPHAALDALPAVARDRVPEQPVMESSDVPAVSDLASSGAVSAAATIVPVRAADGNVAIETASSAVLQALAEYKAAYDALNATAAAVWPTVDQPALARAFSMLESQALALDACDVTVADVTARARCRGSIRAVPRVGSSAPVIVAQTWVFSLRQSDAGWQIQDVTASDSSDDSPTDSSR